MFKTQSTHRLLEAGRRSLGFVQDIHAKRKVADLGRQNRLVKQVRLELDEVMQKGDLVRLEYLLGLVHLSFLFLDEANGPDLHKKLSLILKRIHQRGENQLEARTESTAPLAYFGSYPRSGNTLLMRLVTKATQGQMFTARARSRAFFQAHLSQGLFSASSYQGSRRSFALQT